MDLLELPDLTDDSAAADLLCAAVRPVHVGVFQPGDVLGHYTLLEKLGDGGFAKVWRAEQTQGVQREVALKILKMGMDTMEVIARFEQERQALAMMNHPTIARVYDAGASAAGRPYFVMEYVRGVPVTRYCKDKGCDLEQRLSLMRSICAGVQHAHQKGIIHRDLKPSNILVTDVDGQPVPKIIDFGIAKAVSGSVSSDVMLVTRDDLLIGTPLYMSPEQAAGGGDIDTRSDVYALGALLYELVAGHAPFHGAMSATTGLAEMRRILLEEEPLPPTRVEGAVLANSRDLDMITLKALSKDRSQRYESAAALGDDLGRYLNKEPVVARRATSIYLVQRWLYRHAAMATGCLLAGSLLLAGMVGILWQKQTSDQQAQQADAMLAMLVSVLNRSEVLRHGNVSQVSALVDEVAREAAKFPASNLRLMRLEKALALTFLGLGDTDIAIPHLRRAEVAAVASNAPKGELLEIRLLLLRKLAGRTATSEEAVRYAETLSHVYREPSVQALLLGWRAEGYLQLHEIEKAMRVYAELIPLIKNADPPLTADVIVEARQSYARALRAVGKPADGLAEAKATAQLAENSSFVKDVDKAVALHALGVEYARSGNYGPAAQCFQRALTLRLPSLGHDHPLSLKAEDAMINALWLMGKKRESVDQRRNQFAILHDELGLRDVRTLNRFSLLLGGYDQLGATAEAAQLISTTLAPHRNTEGKCCGEVALLLHRALGHYRNSKRWAQVESAAKELIEILKESEPGGYLAAMTRAELAVALMHLDRHEEAKKEAFLAREALQRYREKESDVEKRWWPLLSQIDAIPEGGSAH